MPSFFANIQKADRATRMRWLIVLSAIAGAFVVLVWVGTLQQIRSGFEDRKTEQPPGTFAKIGDTAKRAWDDLKFGVSNVTSFFHSKLFSNEIELTQTTTTYER